MRVSARCAPSVTQDTAARSRRFRNPPLCWSRWCDQHPTQPDTIYPSLTVRTCGPCSTGREGWRMGRRWVFCEHLVRTLSSGCICEPVTPGGSRLSAETVHDLGNWGHLYCHSSPCIGSPYAALVIHQDAADIHGGSCQLGVRRPHVMQSNGEYGSPSNVSVEEETKTA